jgi:rhamnosyltransferase
MLSPSQSDSYPAVAILLAAYNGAEWLDSQLESILAQERVNVTLFVSVDPSTDKTAELIAGWATQDPRIIVLPQREAQGGATANFFRLILDVDIDAFDYVGFADQDDIWLKDKLARAVKVMAEHNVAGYSSNALAFWDDGRTALIHKAQPQKRWDFLFECAGPGSTFVLSNALISSIKDFLRHNPAKLSDIWLYDWFCYAYARSHAYTWFIDEYAGVQYRQHKVNCVGANQGIKAFMRRAKLVIDGSALRQALFLARLAGVDKDPFVQRLVGMRRRDMLYLAGNAWHCRRRMRDVGLFFCASVLMAFRGIDSIDETDH